MSDLFGLIAALLGGGAAAAIFTAWWKGRGHIKTSEAETLWAESRAIRESQRAENEALRHDLASVNALREQEHQDVLALHEKYGALEAKHDALREEHRQCKEDLATLTAELRKM